MYSRRMSYKGLLDTDECHLNPTADSNQCTESAQIDSTSEPKYNKRIKTLIKHGKQIGPQSTRFEQNFDITMSPSQTFCEKNEIEKNLNRKGANTIIETKNLEVNNLVQHFNDHLKTQAIAEAYSQHNKRPKQLMATYSPNSNEPLSSNDQCEHSFEKIYQNHEHE